MNAQRQLTRLTPLAAKNFTTKQDLDTASANVATLQGTLAAEGLDQPGERLLVALAGGLELGCGGCGDGAISLGTGGGLRG